MFENEFENECEINQIVRYPEFVNEIELLKAEIDSLKKSIADDPAKIIDPR